MTSKLTKRQREYIRALPQKSLKEWADAIGVTKSTVQGVSQKLRDKGVVVLDDGVWRPADDVSVSCDFRDTPVSDEEPDPNELTRREEYLVRSLQTGSTIPELADDLDERTSIITEHLRDLRDQGWQVYHDDDADSIVIESDTALRSSEHKGTRTRKVNRWWGRRHNDLVREFRGLESPSAPQETRGDEDWVLHITDIHAGDRVRDASGNVIYETDDIPDILDYITERSLCLSDFHGAEYDTAHLLWGGDMVTNEGIYEGQFEDLDAWLDEQHDILIDPLIRQIKAHAERFETVQVVCQVGNHGDHRASGTSKQANADLILYKTVRNVVSQVRRHSDDTVLDTVDIKVGEARPYRNFPLRGGRLRGHLRHGQHRRPQAETSARKKEWLSTLLDHDMDIAWLGHHHVSGRIPWNGPPVFATGSPKPGGEFVESLGDSAESGPREIAHCHGVADHGVSSVFPVKDHRL
jgi:DNA-binding MarR family transcriptional regulator